MQTAPARCTRTHFEDHHVRMLQTMRSRLDQAKEELERAEARMSYLADQLDSLVRESQVPR